MGSSERLIITLKPGQGSSCRIEISIGPKGSVKTLETSNPRIARFVDAMLAYVTAKRESRRTCKDRHLGTRQQLDDPPSLVGAAARVVVIVRGDGKPPLGDAVHCEGCW